MANHCSNWIEFSGPAKNIMPLFAKFDQKQAKLTAENSWFWYDIFLSFFKEEDGTITTGFEHRIDDFGSRWLEIGVLSCDSDWEQVIIPNDTILSFTISGESAWAPVENFIRLICEKYKVTGLIEYEEPGCDFGGKHSWDAEGNTVEEIQMTYRAWRYSEDTRYGMDCLLEDIQDDQWETQQEFIDENAELWETLTPNDKEQVTQAFKDLINGN